MKKLLFGLVVTLLMLSAESSSAQELSVHFEFGRKSQNCGGFGICILRLELKLDLSIPAPLIGLRQGNVQIKFRPEFYLANKSKFQNGYLVLEEDFVMEQEITKALGLADGHRLKTGKYLVVFDKTTNTYNCTF